MLSFPSTLNKGGSHLITPQQSSSLKDVLNNSIRSSFNSAISKTTSGRGYDTDGIRYNEDRDTNTQLDNLDFASTNTIDYDSNLLAPSAKNQATIWTPTHMNEAVFSVMNNYRGYLTNILIEMGNDGEVKGSNGKRYKTFNFRGKLAPSLFNPYHGIPIYGIMENVPLLDGVQNPDGNLVHDSNDIANLDDCSINELVRLSSVRKSILGHAKYKYSDFMYCKDLGKISNNHMITLRKFSLPVGDNIFGSTVGENSNKEDPMATVGDIARMITWFDTDDNKLSDIMSYEYQATWKELNSKIQQLNSQEDDEGRGIAGKLINNLNPGYNLGSGEGINHGGLLGSLMTKFGLGSDSHEYQSNDVALGRNYDNNKVYEPRDTIQSSHIYEGKLIFKHEFNLNFSYKLRAYDNINPKSAFLDLIGNILSCTYRKGTFWGGRQEILGAKPNNGMWSKYNNITKGVSDATGQFWKNLFHLEGSNTNSLLGSMSMFGSMLNDIGKANGFDIKGWFSQISDKVSEITNANSPQEAVTKMAEATKGGVKKIAATAQDLNLGQVILGNSLNKLGRPALYAFDSIISGANVGLWHVTIGNPKNPIAVFGNLIMTGCKITHSGPLGIDDFPTDLHVTVSLKHAMPRDSVGIQRMYTKGQNGIYMSLCSPFNTIQFTDGGKLSTEINTSNSKELPPSTVKDATSGNAKQTTSKSKKEESLNVPVPNKTDKQDKSESTNKWDIIKDSGLRNQISIGVGNILSEKEVMSKSLSENEFNKMLDKTVKEDAKKISEKAQKQLDIQNTQKAIEEAIDYLNTNKVYSNRFTFLGSDIPEAMANKDEMR